MSGIPRDYPAGMTGFLQIIRRSDDASGVRIRLVTVDLCGRALKEEIVHFRAAGDGAANRQGAGADVSGAFTPDPRQPADRSARQLYDGTPIETISEDADDLEREGWPGAAKRLRSLLAAHDRLAAAGDSLAAAVRVIGPENSRMRSAITEAIALLEGGTDYERMHVAGTLRGAL